MITFYPDVDGEARVRCDGCGWLGKGKQVLGIESPSERLAAGEEVPAGECPDCGSCCFLIDENMPGLCDECGEAYDDNDPGLDLCKTCSDWTVEVDTSDRETSALEDDRARLRDMMPS